jgi:DUF438 domain-containing protein
VAEKPPFFIGDTLMERIKELTEILRSICEGQAIEKVVELKKQFLVAIEPRDLALAELSLFESSFSVSYLERICDIHLRLFGSSFSWAKVQLPPNHVVAKLLAEHALLLCLMADLEDVKYEIRKLKSCSTVTTEFRKLAHITSHLMGFDEHREMEDELVFLELEKRGCYGLLAMIKAEHLCLDVSTEELLELIASAEEMDFKKFGPELCRIVEFLVPSMREHIFKENNIFFPIALEVIGDPGVWKRIKSLCDQIGYCCLHSGL